MSVTLPSNLIQAINSLDDPDPCLMLLEVDIPGLDEPLRLVNNEVDIDWNGVHWTAFAFVPDTVGNLTKGELPQIQVKVCNVARAVQGYVDAADGGVGSEVTLRVVHAGNLSEATPLIELVFTVVNASANHEWVTFTLSAANTFTRRFPKNKCLKNNCRYMFKDAFCGYSGSETTCDRTLTRCRALSNSSRFGGFPGVGYKGLKI